MSQIFDALLRSEAERAGNEHEPEVEATDLLRYVEDGVASRWKSPTAAGQPEIVTTSLHDERPLTDDILELPQQFGGNGISSIEAPSQSEAEPNQFQSYSVASNSESAPTSYTKPESAAAEAFRLLSVRLRDIRQSRLLKTILITSTVPQEGKSTVASNLACALAQKNGERVLLLEGDVRRPTLSQIFSLDDKPGVCDVLREQSDLRQSVFYLKGPNIWLLAAGHIPDTPLELLQSRRLTAMMKELDALFDWVVIDAPPVLPLADTSIWSRNTDGVLLVARRGVTEKRQLERGIKALDEGKLIGALMNGCEGTVYSNYYYKSPSAAVPAKC